VNAIDGRRGVRYRWVSAIAGPIRAVSMAKPAQIAATRAFACCTSPMFIIRSSSRSSSSSAARSSCSSSGIAASLNQKPCNDYAAIGRRPLPSPNLCGWSMLEGKTEHYKRDLWSQRSCRFLYSAENALVPRPPANYYKGRSNHALRKSLVRSLACHCCVRRCLFGDTCASCRKRLPRYRRDRWCVDFASSCNRHSQLFGWRSPRS